MTNSKNKPKTELGPHTKRILKEMCKRVKEDYNKVNFNAYGWFTRKEWNEADELSFCIWLSKYLKESEAARRELMSFPNTDKDRLAKFAKSFTFNYGWKYKDEKKK